MSKPHWAGLIETGILAASSLLVSCILVLVLDSSGVFQNKGLRLGGGVVVWGACFWLLRGFFPVRAKRERAPLPSREEVRELPTRSQYIDAEVTAIEGAREKGLLYVNMVRASDASQDAQKINAALAKAKHNGVSIRVLVADGVDRLAGARELVREAGVEVRLTQALHFTEMRFLKVDSDLVVIGVSMDARRSDSYDPSDSWATVRSIACGEMFEREFERLWTSAEPFDEYRDKMIARALREHPGNEALASQTLGLPLADVHEFRDSQLAEDGEV